MKWIKMLEGLLLGIGAAAVIGATVWTMWFMYELVWALKCAFGV